MKKRFLFAVFCSIISVQAFCARPKEAVIRIQADNASIFSLRQVVDGDWQPFSATENEENGERIFRFALQEGALYGIAARNMQTKTLYIAPGDKISLHVEENRLVLSDKKNPANRLLEEWQALTGEMRDITIPPLKKRVFYEEFFSRYDAFRKKADKLSGEFRIRDRQADRLIKAYIACELEFFPLAYVFLPKRVSDPVVYDAHPDYYRNIFKSDKFADATVLELPFGLEFVARYVNVAAMFEKSDTRSLENLISYIDAPAVKGAFLVKMSQGIKTYLEAEQLFEKYHHLFTENQTVSFRRTLERLDRQRIRTDFVDFSYPDRHGKRFSAEDFKGKVILLDFWATWCQPCIQEIPHLKALEEHFKNEEIVFIGISVDYAKDRAKWEQFIDQRALPGYQLFSEEGEGETIKHYTINSIPRFMIIGKDGKVASPNAPKPSAPILKGLLEEELRRP